MSLTPSTMLALKTEAPDFTLPEVVTGKQLSLENFKSKKALLVMFICRHCPYVQHIKQKVSKIGAKYKAKNIRLVAINSKGRKKYPGRSPARLKNFSPKNYLT